MRLAAQLFSCKKVCGSFLFLEKAPADFLTASVKKSLPTPSKKIRRSWRVPKKNTKKHKKMAKNGQKNVIPLFWNSTFGSRETICRHGFRGSLSKKCQTFFWPWKIPKWLHRCSGSFFWRLLATFWRLFSPTFFPSKEKRRMQARRCA